MQTPTEREKVLTMVSLNKKMTRKGRGPKIVLNPMNTQLMITVALPVMKMRALMSAVGRYGFGLFWNFNTGKQILPCVTKTKKFGLIGGYVGGV